VRVVKAHLNIRPYQSAIINLLPRAF